MSTLTGKILADFTTSLATALAVGGTSATLQSATDDDGVALVTGVYYFTIDGSNSSKEHIRCSLNGTALTSIYSVSRQGVATSGVARAHRIGATVTLTDFAHIKIINDLINGTTDLDSSNPLKYDGVATIADDAELATKKYVDDTALSGAPDASTTVKGVVEEATQAEVLSKTTAGGTSARLYVNPGTMASTLLSDYKVDTGSANAYAITPAPAITAYTTGQIFSFKAVNANTTTSTLNVNGLGVKTIKNVTGGVLVANDILANQIVVVEYDGTDFIMVSPSGNLTSHNLKSATTLVNVSSATAPSANQVLKATSATAATWQTLPTTFTGVVGTGGTTKDLTDASGTQNIAHGLGTTPLLYKLIATTPIGGVAFAFNNSKTSNADGSSNLPGQSTNTFLVHGGTAGAYQTATISADGTNIILTWTKTGSPTGTVNIIWEALA